MITFYRYTSNDEGIWSAGKRLLPQHLIDEANEARKWMPKPELPEGNYRFYLTEKGKEMYEQTLLKVHQKYLENIKKHEVAFEKISKVGKIVYEDEYQIVIAKEMPQIIKDVGFDFSWSERKVWALDLPTEDISLSELEWHFDIPFWNSPRGGYYDLTPNQVLNDPITYKEEFERITQADLSHPLDIMFWKNRWLLLDGLHRLTKAREQGMQTIKVRKVSKDMIPLIQK